MDVFAKLSFVLLVAWVVLAGFGMTTMPGARKQSAMKRSKRQRGSGDIWATPVVQAPDAEDNLAFPAAPVM